MSILDFDRLLFNKKKPPGILIGHNAITGEPVYIKEDDRKVHQHLIGGSGSGKSKLIELQIRNDIKAGRGMLIIDPVGDLADEIRDYIAHNHLGDKLIYFDANDDDYSIGLNNLEFDDNIRSSTAHVSEVMKGIAKVFGNENVEAMPQLQRWERDALIALTEAKLTLIELTLFMRYANVRDYVMLSVGQTEIKDEWTYFNTITKSTQESYSGALFNRANKFTIGQNVRRIFGQDRTTIDLKKAMDNGMIVLCNLARKKISEEEQKMLAISIIDKVVQAGLSRANIPRDRRRPFYVYLDEFGLFVSRDIAVALWELRKFNVRFILAHQELGQIEDEQLLSAVLSEPQVKVAFRVGREDAEKMMLEMFAGQIHGDEIKFDNYITTELHEEETRTIRVSALSDGTGRNKGGGKASGQSQIPASNWSMPDSGENITSFFMSANDIDSLTSSSTISDSVTEVPFLKPVRVQQLSSRQFYSLEEMKEKFISWIQAQPDRHAIVKIGKEKPIPVVIANVKKVKATEYDIKKVKEQSNSKYALPSLVVDHLIEQRREKILTEANEMNSLPERRKK